MNDTSTTANDPVWLQIREEAAALARDEPILASFFHSTILNHDTFEAALGFHLANKIGSATVPPIVVREVMDEALAADPDIGRCGLADCRATVERDPAVELMCTPFLYLKGYLSLQNHRISHWLWGQNRRALASFLQSRVAEVFGVDIHPAARMGQGIMFDHATGIVVGETAVVENDVSILQSVTLGGTGKAHGDRHPKVREGVMIGAGAKILGNVEIGKGAKVGAGSVVLEDVPPHVTVVGVPAKVVGRPQVEKPSLDMNQNVGLDLG
ncbi:MAG: serine O-acetyltransferase [Gammaproteobacteria bacterium]